MNAIDFSDYSVNSLIDLRNKISSHIDVIESNISNSNVELLLYEIRNLLSHVGEGYREETYYASERYYSNIPGVKNIRIISEANPNENINGIVSLKILSPRGKLVPSKINIDGLVYDIEFWKSRNYSPEIDY